MLDVKRLRREPEEAAAALARRGVEGAVGKIADLLRHDADRRDALAEGSELRAVRNRVSKEIGEAKRAGRDAAAEVERMRKAGQRIAVLDARAGAASASASELLAQLPNLPDSRVPAGGEEANVVVRRQGEPADSAGMRPHWEVAEALGILDLAAGARVSGSGFPVLRGKGAALQRGLIDWMIRLHVADHGYTEVRVPYLVTGEAMTGTGQLPKFADESYQVGRDDLWLIPTAEVPVTNLHRDEILPCDALPTKYVAYSPCFRREAGAAGRDTRGLLRVHQFDKVELVRFERPDARGALDELVGEAARVLELLGLPHRVVLLAGEDLGFSASLTYDLETWAPGVGQWLEVSSCSTFSDFQARRAAIRFRERPGAATEHVHTLNGSGLALPRVMAALVETHQQPDGSVRLPEPLASVVGFSEISPGA